MTKLGIQQIKDRAEQIVLANSNGIRWAEIARQITAENPETNPRTIQTALSQFGSSPPATVRKLSRGLYAPAVPQNSTATQAASGTAPPPDPDQAPIGGTPRHGVSMDAIEEFVARYTREYDFFQAASQHCAARCEAQLRSTGIRAIVTHRAKRPDRLREKLVKRNGKHPYADCDAIYTDIADLAGVRIALYFPGDREEVNRLLIASFEVTKTKEFPILPDPTIDTSVYTKVFSGYAATHYRVHLRSDDLPDGSKHYAWASIEIQVASVLMHAWSEVEHDLVYKPGARQVFA